MASEQININSSSSITHTMKFDLHVHTHFSRDSDSDIDELIHTAENRGLDGFAVCDHDTIEGGQVALRRASELNSRLIIIPGIEVSTSEGHLLVLDVKEPIPAGLTPQETIKRAQSQNAVVILPHPFKITSHGIGHIEGLDVNCVEVINSRCLTNDSNNKARVEAIKLGFPQTGGSDCHEPAMIGMAYTHINSTIRTKEGVLEALKQGNVSAGGGLTPKKFVFKQMIINAKNKIIQNFK